MIMCSNTRNKTSWCGGHRFLKSEAGIKRLWTFYQSDLIFQSCRTSEPYNPLRRESKGVNWSPLIESLAPVVETNEVGPLPGFLVVVGNTAQYDPLESYKKTELQLLCRKSKKSKQILWHSFRPISLSHCLSTFNLQYQWHGTKKKKKSFTDSPLKVFWAFSSCL